MVLKPQDVLVALNLCLPGAKGLSYAEKAKALGMSASEVHAAEKRLCEARLVQEDSKGVRRGPLLEFLIQAARCGNSNARIDAIWEKFNLPLPTLNVSTSLSS